METNGAITGEAWKNDSKYPLAAFECLILYEFFDVDVRENPWIIGSFRLSGIWFLWSGEWVILTKTF